jgi:hypothetical protein
MQTSRPHPTTTIHSILLVEILGNHEWFAFFVSRTYIVDFLLLPSFLLCVLVQKFAPNGALEGPQAMLKSALLYGGFVYLLSGGSGSGRLEYINDSDIGF